MALLNQVELKAWYWHNLFSNSNAWLDDYHITPEQLFRRPKEIEPTQSFYEAQGGDERKEAPPPKPESRLSFDFCELTADQLLESTPASYRNDRANGSVFNCQRNAKSMHDS